LPSLRRQSCLYPEPDHYMKRLVIYGLLTGLSIAGWTYLEYLLGFHANPMGRYTGYLALLLTGLGLVLGMRAYRNQEQDGFMGYWEAVMAGAVITLMSGLIQAGFTYLYYVYINPGFVDFLVEMKRQELTGRRATASQLAAQARQIRDYYQPLPMAFRSFGGFVAGGLLFTLILAALLKKTRPEQD
jgi:hypothetical protein